MAFFVGDIAPTVIEAINKIGSLANGPILAVFALGFLTRRTAGWHAVVGLLLGMGGNALLWLYQPQVSWLWWNVIGFVVTFASGVALSVCGATARADTADTGEGAVRTYLATEARYNWYRRSALLLAWFMLLLALLAALGGD
jgi:SSS family solute:Na+ symporter